MPLAVAMPTPPDVIDSPWATLGEWRETQSADSVEIKRWCNLFCMDGKSHTRPFILWPLTFFTHFQTLRVSSSKFSNGLLSEDELCATKFRQKDQQLSEGDPAPSWNPMQTLWSRFVWCWAPLKMIQLLSRQLVADKGGKNWEDNLSQSSSYVSPTGHLALNPQHLLTNQWLS